MEEFGSLAATLAAPVERLARWCGVDGAARLASVRAAYLHASRAEMLDRAILASSTAVAAYLRIRLAHQRAEIVLALFLDCRSRLIRDEIVYRGSLDKVSIRSREIVGRALELNAASVIIAHNHPSGDPTPSAADIAATRQLGDGLRACDLTLIDHMVVGRAGTSSLRALGLM